MNVTNAEAKLFEGTGGVTDRCMLIELERFLKVFGDLYSTSASSRFVVKLEDRASAVSRTRIQVGTSSSSADVKDINMNVPNGNDGEHREFTIYGDVVNSSIIGNDDTVVFVEGDVTATSTRQLFLRGTGTTKTQFLDMLDHLRPAA